jgi:hypothetical protein
MVMTKKDGTPARNAKGKIKRVKPNVLLDAHRHVEQMTWAPGLPLTTEDKLIAEGGLIERCGVTTFNLYRPPAVRQGNSAGADRWLQGASDLPRGRRPYRHILCAPRAISRGEDQPRPRAGRCSWHRQGYDAGTVEARRWSVELQRGIAARHYGSTTTTCAVLFCASPRPMTWATSTGMRSTTI